MEGLALLLLYLAIPSLLFSAVKQVLSWRKSLESQPRFPGPRQFPIVGRVHDLPRFSLWLKFKEWADEHGPIYYTRALNARFIIVSDEQIAEELLVKRGHVYSGRPQIRSLIKHKEGPVYSALMDRHGKTGNHDLHNRAPFADSRSRHLEDTTKVDPCRHGGSVQTPLLRALREGDEALLGVASA
jgi:hypothetical protein